jgi:hypothetical protein
LSKCNYGITILAEEKGELNQECDSPVTRNITALKDQMILYFCEKHYQEIQVWDNEK